MSSESKTEITREVSATRGRYVARVEGIDAEGELTYSRAGPSLVIAEHTSVDDRLRGRGLALALVSRLVEDARAEGFKIYPLCPYVNAERRKHPDWADVFQD
jgi:predicted GNAT family acetyltransferase